MDTLMSCPSFGSLSFEHVGLALSNNDYLVGNEKKPGPAVVGGRSRKADV